MPLIIWFSKYLVYRILFQQTASGPPTKAPYSTWGFGPSWFNAQPPSHTSGSSGQELEKSVFAMIIIQFSSSLNALKIGVCLTILTNAVNKELITDLSHFNKQPNNVCTQLTVSLQMSTVNHKIPFIDPVKDQIKHYRSLAVENSRGPAPVVGPSWRVLPKSDNKRAPGGAQYVVHLLCSPTAVQLDVQPKICSLNKQRSNYIFHFINC